MIFRCEKVEKIYFTVEADSEEQVQEFLQTHGICEIVDSANANYIESDDSERVICPVDGCADISLIA